MAGRSPSTHRDPAYGGVVIDYSGGDQTLAQYARGVYVSAAGNLKVDMLDGSTITFSNLAAGQYYPFTVRKIYQTGSTAAGVALL